MKEKGTRPEPAEVIISRKTVAIIPQPDSKRTLVVTATIENVGKSPARDISLMADCGGSDSEAVYAPTNWASTPDESRRVEISCLAPGETAQITIPVAIQESHAQCPEPSWLLRVTCFGVPLFLVRDESSETSQIATRK